MFYKINHPFLSPGLALYYYQKTMHAHVCIIKTIIAIIIIMSVIIIVVIMIIVV